MLPTQRLCRRQGRRREGRLIKNGVGEILSVPTGQRKEVLANFKQNFEKQEHAWVRCQLALENQVNEWPNTQKEGLMETLDSFAQQNSFDPKSTALAEHKIDDYLRKHKKVVDFLEKNTDDLSVINNLTDLKLNEDDILETKVSVSPMFFEIVAPLAIYSKFRDGFGHDSKFVTGGFVAKSKNGVDIIFINRDSDFASQKEISDHETTHEWFDLVADTMILEDTLDGNVCKKIDGNIMNRLKNKIYEKAFGIKQDIREELFNQYKKSSDKNEKLVYFGELLKHDRKVALENDKNEILAYIKGGRKLDNDEIDASILHNYGGLDDMLAGWKNFCEKSGDDSLVELSNKILVDDYKKIVYKSVESFYKLVSDGGYSEDEARIRLRRQPLRLWPKIVNKG